MTKLYAGLSLADNSNNYSGLVVLNDDNEIVNLEKFLKMQEIENFFNNYKEDLNICVALPWNNSMLNGKWRITSKPYQRLEGTNVLNRDNWIQRYSNRGKEFFTKLASRTESFNYFETYLTRQAMGLTSGFKERTPADCKFLQGALKSMYGIDCQQTNMMPMAQLEAIVGALLAKKYANDEKTSVLFEFNDINVINSCS